MWRIFVITGAGALFFFSLLILRDDGGREDGGAYRLISYDRLENWSSDQQAGAFQAFLKSCGIFLSQPAAREISPTALGGVAGDWHPVCRQAEKLDPLSHDAARQFFERHFTPLTYADAEDGLFTGYFAPEYAGSAEPSDRYPYPLYARPPDLKILDLGQFKESLAGETIVGEIKDGDFIPYKDRERIDRGALAGQQLELAWLKDPADAFFMQVQGSGVIRFEDGRRKLFGYAAKNGRAYHSIGKFLIESGDVSREEMSLQAIRRWMTDNPAQARDLLWKNPSYVFFRPLEQAAPVGSQTVELTPGRSLAVDRSHVPLGMPVWLDLMPATENADPIRRLVIAQDTGGAIKGRVRGDLYWGIGEDARLMAGPMKDRGRFYFLLPNRLAEKILAPKAQGGPS